MQIVFESRDPEAAQMREIAVNRLRFVMRRLNWLVPRATLHLSDVNGPRGGIDKRCQLELKTDHAGTVVVTAMAHDWRAALDGAMGRAARALLRSVRKVNHTMRQHGRSESSQRRSSMAFDG
jgi:ribosome-associated translation inhibitor RaiA